MNALELDYYNILNVKRNATKEDIYIAYRKLAVKYHPLLLQNESSIVNAHHRQWSYINMAFDVLGNDLRRSIYDRFGESGLLQFQYQYHGNHMQVYHDVFGSYSPYANVIDAISSTPPLYSNTDHGIGVRTKDSPVIKRICLDLEEVYNGCIKLMHVWRQEFIDSDELRTEKRKKTLTLSIHPGVKPGTTFCFSEEGDRFPNKIPSDIIFIVEDKPHESFKRNSQNDILYVHEINLCQALTGFKCSINTFGKHLNINISDVVYPGFTKVIHGEGLPKCKDLDLRKSPTIDYGDFIIEFRIIFPRYLTIEMKQSTQKFFAELNKMEEMATDDDATFRERPFQIN